MHSKPALSIVIPNYNGAQLLRKNLPACLTALERYSNRHTGSSSSPTSNADSPHQIIVVDDASTDDSISVLRTEFPQVEVVAHAHNAGYSKAVYSGITAANHEIVILLNSDVVPRPDCLHQWVSGFDDPKVFAISPLIYDDDETPVRASWNRPQMRHGKLQFARWQVDEFIDHKKRLHLFASGGSMALRREVFLQLGGYLDIYRPFYYEDMDLGVRAWRAGWKVLLEPSCTVYHPQGSTIKRFHRKWKIATIMQRNRLLLHWIHLPLPTLFFSHMPHLLLRHIEHLVRLDLIAFAALSAAMLKLPIVFVERRKLSAPQYATLHQALERIETDS